MQYPDHVVTEADRKQWHQEQYEEMLQKDEDHYFLRISTWKETGADIGPRLRGDDPCKTCG